MSKKSILTSLIVMIITIFASITLNAQTKDSQEITNLRAFAKLYGYVRFFHPSDESANLDWDKFAIYGVEEILKCKDDNELKETLKRLYYPVAPTIHIYNNPNEIENKSIIYSKDTTGMNVVAWQHYGVWLSEDSFDYRSYRVIKGTQIITPKSSVSLKTIDRKPQPFRMFEAFPKTGEFVHSKIADNIFFDIPLTLYSDSLGTQGKNENYLLCKIKEQIDLIDIKKLTGDEFRIRLADVILTWNICQHFYPYFDAVKVDWNEVLTEFLSIAMKDDTAMDFYYTLRKMTAKLEDGHTYVSYAPANKIAGWPLRVELIDNDLYVTASVNSDVKRGDIIMSIDGKPALQALYEREKIISGSKHYKRLLALKELGDGPEDQNVRLIIFDGEKQKEIEIKRMHYGIIQEYQYSPISKIDNGIYYVNVFYVDTELFDENLENLVNAKGIIFDFRFTSSPRRGKIRLNLFSHLLHRIINCDVEVLRIYDQCCIYPDRKEVSLHDGSEGVFPYGHANFKSKNVFLIDSDLSSYNEIVPGIIEAYKLGEIIGAPTAGANGTMNTFNLPGGYTFSFTGRVVIKQDGSQHHLIGVQPTIKVNRTIKAVREGRDEYLEKAIEVLRSKIK